MCWARDGGDFSLRVVQEGSREELGLHVPFKGTPPVTLAPTSQWYCSNKPTGNTDDPIITQTSSTLLPESGKFNLLLSLALPVRGFYKKWNRNATGSSHFTFRLEIAHIFHDFMLFLVE